MTTNTVQTTPYKAEQRMCLWFFCQQSANENKEDLFADTSHVYFRTIHHYVT